MLSIDNQLEINGITIYRDLQNTDQYYCLPPEKARISNNGKGIEFIAYIDDEIQEGTTPEFDDDINRSGGFLTLEVELGPDEAVMEALLEELRSEKGQAAELARVPFIEGKVELFLFGRGKDSSNPNAADISIAGSTKPSLYGKQTAVFSLRMGGMEAQIMWNLLKDEAQTQASIVYDLEYLGIVPSYNLEITIDFKATEEYWRHKINTDFSLKGKNIGIAASADIDLMMRDLVNQGAIEIKQINFGEGQDNSILGEDDPTGIKLVRELMGPTLFQPTAIPSIDYTALDQANGDDNNNTSNSLVTNNSSSNTTDTNEEDEDESSENGDSDTQTEENGDSDTPTEDNDDSADTDTQAEEDNPETENPEHSDDDAKNEQEEDDPTEPRIVSEEDDGDDSEDDGNTTDSDDQDEDEEEGGEEDEEEDEPEREESPSEVSTEVNVNIGYSLQHRSISEQIKRTFVFNKAQAKRNKIHPGGALQITDTAFDPDTQVKLVRLGAGPFKQIDLEIRSALDFDEYRIQEAIVHLSYGYKDREGDKENMKVHDSFLVDKEKPRTFISIPVDDFGTLSYDYYVEFIHEPGSIIGTHQTKIQSRKFVDVTERDISVNIDDHSPLIPVEIQVGSLQFSDDGIQSAQVFLAPEEDATGRTAVLKANSDPVSKFLIKPSNEEKLEYFKKETFFYEGEPIMVESPLQKDTQVILNTPSAKLFTIAPNLVDSANMIQDALIDIRYVNSDSVERKSTLRLNNEQKRKEYSIRVDSDDPRIWFGKARYILTNGEILSTQEREFDIPEPIFSLANTGFRVIKLSTLLGEATFTGNIAAIEVEIFSSGTESQSLDTVILRQGNVEEIVILRDTDASERLNASTRIFRTDGAQEELSFSISQSMDELLLRITNINTNT